MSVKDHMTVMAPMGVLPMVGIRDKVASFIKVAPDRETKDLLKEVLGVFDKPYDLGWAKTEFKLSPAEFRVLGLLVEGKAAAGISEATGTQISTVRVHISKIYRKMGVTNMAELTALLLQRACFI